MAAYDSITGKKGGRVWEKKDIELCAWEGLCDCFSPVLAGAGRKKIPADDWRNREDWGAKWQLGI